MKLHGIHHVTCITGDAPENLDVLHRHARAAARQEDRQPGRPDRLPPLLRRRARLGRRRHHVLRVPRATAAARGRDGAPRRLPRRQRGVARLLGGARRRRAQRRLARLRRPGRPRARARRRRLAATRRSSRATPRSRRSTRSAGSPACARTQRRRRRARVPRGLAFDGSGRGWESRGEPRSGFYVYDAPPAERGVPGARHRAPRRVGVAARRARRLASRRCEARRAADAGDRPLLVQLDLLPRAERRPVRDRVARPRASPPTRTLEHLGEKLILPPTFEHLRAQVEPHADAAAEPARARRA